MKVWNKQLQKYYRCVWACLSCSGKLKRKLLERLKEQVANYLEENPDADMEMIRNRFGTPQQIAAAVLEEQPAAEVLQKLQIRRKLIAIAGTVALLIILLWLIVIVIALVQHFIAVNGHIAVSPVEVS